MLDWSKIHTEEIAPALAKFAGPPPPLVLVILLVIFLVGLAMIIWAPAKFKAVGFVLICAMLFVSYMTAGSYFRAKHRLARYEYGTVLKKYVKQSTRKDSRGMVLPVTTHFIELEVSEARALGSKGATNPLPQFHGKQKRLVAESLYKQLQVNTAVYCVVLPTAKGAVYLVVRKNGTVVR